MRTESELMGNLDGSLAGAQACRAKGEPGLELNALSSAINDCIRFIVRFAPPTAGPSDLPRSEAVLRGLLRLQELNRQAYTSFLATGKVERAVMCDAIPTHFAWFVGMPDVALDFISIATDPKVQGIFCARGFWTEYLRAIRSLAHRQPYTLSMPKLQGYQKYCQQYLHLIAAITSGDDHSAALAEVNAAFQARNKDKRLIDWDMFDGDGKDPVAWDFRLESIMRFIRPSTSS